MAAHEPYVADPAEPRRRRRLAQRVPLIAVMAMIVAVLGLTLLIFTRGATDDPALGDRPSPAATDAGQ